jgi:hypothetical protein
MPDWQPRGQRLNENHSTDTTQLGIRASHFARKMNTQRSQNELPSRLFLPASLSETSVTTEGLLGSFDEDRG